MLQGKPALAAWVALLLMAGRSEAGSVSLSALGGTDFFSVAPCRVIDTRDPDGPLGGPALVAGADRNFPLNGVCGIPSDATAVSVNIAVTGAAGPGNLRLHAGGTAVPLVATINFSAGQTRSNNAVVGLSPAGELAAFVGGAAGSVHLILDVNGYFAPSPPALIGFGPAMSFVDVGQMSVPTYPTPLTVTLDGPAASDTFVTVGSSNPGAVDVTSGGVMILAGQTSAPVLVSGLSAGTSTLTATLGLVSLTASVQAEDGSAVPELISLLPETASMPSGGTLQLTVGLDRPAPPGGTTVSLAAAPPGAGTVPATVTVPQGQISAQFDYVHGGVSGSATVSATLDATTLSSQITIAPPGTGLVINEVDYDQPGMDTTEFVEIYNPTIFAAPLADLALILVNGNVPPAEYRRVPLAAAGTLPAGGYLVIATAAVTVPAAAVHHIPPTAQWPAMDAVQNGAPDGMLLVNTATSTVIDRLSYEGSITVTIAGFGAVDLVEGTPTTAADNNVSVASISRIPNGTDTDNAGADWGVTTTPSPGGANVP